MTSLQRFSLNKSSLIQAGAWGAISSIFDAGNIKRFGQAFINGAINTVSNLVSDIRSHKPINMGNILVNFIVGFVGGLLRDQGLELDSLERTSLVKVGLMLLVVLSIDPCRY